MDSLRIDKWLWFARVVKTRSLAQRLIDDGIVAVNGQTIRKASAPVKPGDRLTVVRDDRPRTLIVRTLAERRGPAATAAQLYEEETGRPSSD